MESEEVRIEIDDRSGFCFGVVTAIGKAEEALRTGEVYCLGDIVHNRLEVQRLETLGLRTVGHEDMALLGGRRMLIRAHGEPPSTYERAAGLGIRIIDATCPVVAGLQRLVAEAYREMKACGGQVVILGKRGHAEVIGLQGQTSGEAIIVEGASDLDAVDFARPVYFLAQTTQSLALFGELAKEILRRSACPDKVMVRDTICRQVSSREEHLRRFAGRFDAVIFVCGHKSSNGRVLYDVCRGANPHTYNIEDYPELRGEWFEGVGSVGICGATSTPQWLMQRTAERVRELVGTRPAGAAVGDNFVEHEC